MRCSARPAGLALGVPEALDVPRVGLAHPARRRARGRGARPRRPSASRARRGSRRGRALRSRRPAARSNSHGLPERAAGEHHRGRAGALVGRQDALAVAQAAGEDHRRGQRLDQPRREVVVGHALVVDGRAARVKADRRDAGLLDEPVGKRVAVGVPRPLTAAQLTVTGRPLPSAAARATATAVSGS